MNSVIKKYNAMPLKRPDQTEERAYQLYDEYFKIQQ